MHNIAQFCVIHLYVYLKLSMYQAIYMCLSCHFVLVEAFCHPRPPWHQVLGCKIPWHPPCHSQPARQSECLCTSEKLWWPGSWRIFTGKHGFLHPDAEASKNQKDFYWVHLRGCVKLWSHTPNVFLSKPMWFSIWTGGSMIFISPGDR